MAGLSVRGEGLPLDLQQVVADAATTSSKVKKTRRLRISSVEELREREEPKWTVFSASQNLAAALNDPAGREPDLFTKTWGSYFIPTAPLPPSNIALPNIELGDFLRYLKETSAVSLCCLLDMICQAAVCTLLTPFGVIPPPSQRIYISEINI